MTHELRELIETAIIWQKSGIKAVLASVVALEGSSYRRPGVRMLLNEDGNWLGAVSGGCVEKEVAHQAETVFKTQKAKLMTYDGRFRLGCEGILYILLEPIHITDDCYDAFQKTIANRVSFGIDAFYSIDGDHLTGVGSILKLDNKEYALSDKKLDLSGDPSCFSQEFQPIFQLYILGAEHDAVQLCKMANQIGWEVHIVAPPDEAKSLSYFEGAQSLLTPNYANIDTTHMDAQCAVVLMTHSFNKDIQYLMALREVEPAYIGILGPVHRRERIFAQFLDYYPETSVEFFEKIYGPMGINIGAESASEIALSILAEILAVMRSKNPLFLRDKVGHIHE